MCALVREGEKKVMKCKSNKIHILSPNQMSESSQQSTSGTSMYVLVDERVKEKEKFRRTRALAIALAIALVVLLLTAFSLLVVFN